MSIRECCVAIVSILVFSASNASSEELRRANIQNVTLQMDELARDGVYEIYTQQRHRKVDANSTLRLTFHVPSRPGEVEFTREWQNLISVLERLRDAQSTYDRLFETAKRLQANDSPADSTFIQECQSAQNQALEILNDMITYGILTSPELSNLAAKNAHRMYGAIIDVVNSKREKLHANASRFANEAQKYKVVVRAFLFPLGGQRQALHIEGYDKLPQGVFEPIDPKGIIPTPQEARKLYAELEAARTVAAAIEEIRANGSTMSREVQETLDDILSEIESTAQDLREEIGALSDDWEELTDSTYMSQLTAITTPDDESADFVRELREIRKDVQSFERVLGLAQESADFLRQMTSFGGVPFSQLTAHVDSISALANSINYLSERVAAWPARLKTIDESTPAVVNGLAEGPLKEKTKSLAADVSDILESAAARLSTELPKTANALKVFTTWASSGAFGFAQATKELGAEEPEYIPHPLDELTPAELDLRRTGVTLGDQVMITVEIRPVETNDAAQKVTTPTVTYVVTTTLAGFHREYSGDVIFSKATSGPRSGKFRTNAAVSLEWHNYDRDGKGFSGWFSNGLDPGIGFHAAFLSQDPDESVEIGVGVNISIIKGLIRGGYGYDLSVGEDNEYWFIGFGLVSTLQKIQNVASKTF